MLLVVLSHDDFILIVLADDSSSDSDTNPPPITIPQLSRCGDRALVDFLNIDVDLKWDSIGRGSRDIVNSSAWHVRSCVALAMGFPAHHPVAVAHAIALSTGRHGVLPSVAVAQASVAPLCNLYEYIPACASLSNVHSTVGTSWQAGTSKYRVP